MFLRGVPEFGSRLLRMAEAGMGPASFLMPEDLTVASRNQLGLHARTAAWLELGRGLNRERVHPEGRTVSHGTDETTNRALSRHHRTARTEAEPVAAPMVSDTAERAVVEFLHPEARLAHD